MKGIPGRVLGTFVRFQYSCFKTTRCLLFTLLLTTCQLLQQPCPAPLMTSCAVQQQTLDRAADLIYLNCNPTLHKKKKNPCAKKKISYSRLPLRQLRCLLAYFITLSSRPRSNIAGTRPTRSLLLAALPLRRMFVFVPRQLRCGGAPRARPASARLVGRGGSAHLPRDDPCRSPPSFPPQDAHPDSHGEHGVLRLAIPHQPEHASLARGRPLRRGEGGERSRGRGRGGAERRNPPPRPAASPAR